MNWFKCFHWFTEMWHKLKYVIARWSYPFIMNNLCMYYVSLGEVSYETIMMETVLGDMPWNNICFDSENNARYEEMAKNDEITRKYVWISNEICGNTKQKWRISKGNIRNLTEISPKFPHTYKLYNIFVLWLMEIVWNYCNLTPDACKRLYVARIAW